MSIFAFDIFWTSGDVVAGNKWWKIKIIVTELIQISIITIIKASSRQLIAVVLINSLL